MRSKVFLLVLLAIVLLATSVSAQGGFQYEKLSDGVEHWYRARTANEKPWFFQQLENIFDVMLSRPDKLPFGRSVAFLIGVSDYQYISPDLPFVKNDLQDVRQFLLDKGGFDEVYVASEKIVTRDLIEDYMRNKFPTRLKPEDRLLFYYSGHGADAGGRTGYMQFAGAQRNNFAGAQILPIKDITYWCDEIDINHLLFLLDCCASGLAFASRGQGGDEIQQMIATLSRDGSRTIITAGTAEEQTFEVPRPGGKGNGVFTRALLNALEMGMTDKGKDGFLTVEEIFARTKDEVAAFASKSSKNLTPRCWPYDEGNYRGTFIFINPEARNQRIVLADNYLTAIAATPRGQKVAEFGIVQVKSFVSGDIYIDGTYVGKIESGDVINYDQSVGWHKIEIKAERLTFVEQVNIIKGTIQNMVMDSTKIPPKKKREHFIAEYNRLLAKYSKNILASIPQELSDADVKIIFQHFDFYCKEYDYNKEFSNPNGSGFANLFESKTIQGDKVIVDNASGLIWQQGGSDEWMSFEAAKKWIIDLNKNGYAGFNDWRLPTLQEAMSLMEPTQLNCDLYIDPKFDTKQRWIWTSDLMPRGSWAWIVNFFHGSCGWYTIRIENPFVRAVRIGQSDKSD